MITDVKSVREKSNLSTSEYIAGLEKIRKNKSLFKIIFASNLPPLQNVFFQSLKITQSRTNGTARTLEGGKADRSSFKISFTVKEIRLSTKAKVSKIQASELNIAKETEATTATNFDDKNDEDLTESQKTGKQILALMKGKGATTP